MVYAVLWALGNTPDTIAIIIYSFLLGNFSVNVMERLASVFGYRPFPWNWVVFVGLLLALMPVAVASSSWLVWLATGAPGDFIAYLLRGWSFPTLVTLVVGILYHGYRDTREKLQERNRQLQQRVEIEVVQRELHEQELERAREIQISLLPKELEQVEGFQVVAAWEPARLVGGDYFDVIRLDDARLGICIADVAGKSVSAALLMASVQATARAFATTATSPSGLCSRVNRVLCNNIAPEKFVTFFYGVLDAAQRTFTYTNAGHLPPFLLRPGQAQRMLEASGMVLGVMPDWEYTQHQLTLAAGERILLFTDGMSEAESATGQEYGEERLAQAAQESAGAPAVLVHRLIEKVKSHSAGPLRDDATLVMIAAL